MPQPTSPAIIVGSVAASATTGALIAMGHRAGSVGLAFAAIGAALFQRTSNSGAVGLVFTGLVLHIAAIFVWSVVFTWLAERGTGRHFAAAATVGAAQFAFSWLVAWATGKGLASALPLGDLVAFSLLLAIALWLGIRIAFFGRGQAEHFAPHRAPQL